jgi:F0F1-type ATP synthase assembly protein I
LILTSDPGTRSTAAKILLWQTTAVTAVAVICYALFGGRSGLSALAGGAIGLVANASMTMTALRPTRSPGGALGRLLFGQLVKVALTVTLFVIVARDGRAHWPSLLVAYIVTLAVFWLVPAFGPRGNLGKVREG